MKWFKFYGQDFLTDPKMRLLSQEETSCWVVLLCLANAEDKQGKISFISEEEVMHQAKIEFDTPMWHSTLGFFEKFAELKMITIEKESVTKSDKPLHFNVTLINFSKRQKGNTSGAERQKRYRERVKLKLKSVTQQHNAGDVTSHNAVTPRVTLEENRLDKKISTKVDTGEKPPVVLAGGKKVYKQDPNAKFGNEFVNLCIEEFSKGRGFTPTDRYFRNECHLLVRSITKVLKDRGRPIDPERIKKSIIQYFDWIFDQDWADQIQTMSVVRRKLPVFVAELEGDA